MRPLRKEIRDRLCFRAPVLRPAFQCCSLSANPALGEALGAINSADLPERLWEPHKGPLSEGVSKGFLVEVSLEMNVKREQGFGSQWRETQGRVFWESGIARMWTQRNGIPQVS